jgi:hypothetical protein
MLSHLHCLGEKVQDIQENLQLIFDKYYENGALHANATPREEHYQKRQHSRKLPAILKNRTSLRIS